MEIDETIKDLLSENLEEYFKISNYVLQQKAYKKYGLKTIDV